jgi:peptidoglycan/xylan/chitin deacetylase (PgdA/CDA1 family)
LATGYFFRLEAVEGLPEDLAAVLPTLLWIPSGSVELAPPEEALNPVLVGHSVDGSLPLRVPLVSLADGSRPILHFDAARTADEILLEHYYDGLERPLEMRLPFNYTLLPTWVRSTARRLRGRQLVHEPEIAFPPDGPSHVVDWLCDLAQWAETSTPTRRLKVAWPDTYRAAVTVCHDVDTDWVFENPRWIDRFCDLEERHGLRGAWYCVPTYSQTPAATKGIERLRERGCEIGCHGYNHDTRWPFLGNAAFQKRMDGVRQFRDRWGVRGFRSEWLWRTPTFLQAIGQEFDYDSSIPTVSRLFTSHSRNGCGTAFPYRTHGDLVELPITLPIDDDRHLRGEPVDQFWRDQVERAHHLVERGGMLLFLLHPQPHQAANDETLAAVDLALEQLDSIPDLWNARPDEIVDWVLKPSSPPLRS